MATKKNKKEDENQKLIDILEPSVKKIIVLYGSDSHKAHFSISRDGIVTQNYHECANIDHLDLGDCNFAKMKLPVENLNRISISINMENAGPLMQMPDGLYYPLIGHGDFPIKYPYEYCNANRWHGVNFYERYHTAQLKSMQELLHHLCDLYYIPTFYNSKRWYPTCEALSGSPGIYFHCSFSSGAYDLHPQIELINTLKAL